MSTDALIGLLANSLSCVVTHPVDVVKTKYQVGASLRDSVKGRLFAGLGPNLCTYPIFWGVFFGTNAHLSTLYRRWGVSGHANNIVTAYSSSLIGSTLTNPLFVVKVRMQTGRRSLWETVREIRGWSTYFRGLPSTCVSNSKLAIQFPLYSYLRENHSVLVASVLSKCVASTVFYPLDLVRTRQRNAGVSQSMLVVARDVVREFGARGLFRGLAMYHCYSTPNFVCMMLFTELFRTQLNEQNI